MPELRERSLISDLFGVNLFCLSAERSSVVLKFFFLFRGRSVSVLVYHSRVPFLQIASVLLSKGFKEILVSYFLKSCVELLSKMCCL